MATKVKKSSNTQQDEIKWPYGKKNYVVFAFAMITIIIGFISLSRGSITLAPILLVIGYCVLLPIALIIKGRPEKEESAQQEPME